MYTQITRGLRRSARWAIIGTAAAAGALLAAADSASAATIATFSNGVLTVFGDSNTNNITVSRNASGTLLVNFGAIPVVGGTPNVANTTAIQVFGQAGSDVITLNESAGALPRANLFGGTGDDTLTGGSGGDLLFGQSDNDTLVGRFGFDTLFGGDANDTLTGGDADDQVFGEGGNDTMISNAGDDTDLNEGGPGTDTVVVNGGGGGEAFTAAANGARVRFDRVDAAPFSVDIGTSENLRLNANAGNDSFSASGNLAALISVVADGGLGADTLLGSNGADVLLGGDNDDFIDGQQGADVTFAGNGNDAFQWDPGDGSDVVEGQGGADTLVFNGSNASERFTATAVASRTQLTRDVNNIIVDTNDLEAIDVRASAGSDTVTVNDLSGTDVVELNAELGGSIGGTAGDGQPDTVIVNGTNGADVIDVFGTGTSASVVGLDAFVSISGSEAATDSLVLNALGQNDEVTATTLAAGVIKPVFDGGSGDDTILGSQAADTVLGGDGADFVLADGGSDVAILGAQADTFQWNPGDGSDTVEGQADTDTMLFFGSSASETIDVASNGGRIRFIRNIDNVAMDLDDVESVEFRTLGGADNVVVGDLSGTDLATLNGDLRGASGGGDGASDTVTVNGTNGADVIAAVSDAGTIEVSGLRTAVNVRAAEARRDLLVLNALGGDDQIDARGLAADAMTLTENGGLGGDTLLGSPGRDLFFGGDGNDLALMGGGDDAFTWNPGDDNDILEGQAGADTMLFNGSNASERVDISALGQRMRLFRDVANVSMDLNDVEVVDLNAFGGADTVTVNDLSGTDVTNVGLALGSGGGDGAPDGVIVRATNGNDVGLVSGNSGGVAVTGLPARVDIFGSEPANDRLTIDALAGDDVVEASGLLAGAIQLTELGGTGDDVLVGSAGNDVLDGGAGDDVLLGGLGLDVINGGDGDDIEIQGIVAVPGSASSDRVSSATPADAAWIVEHVRIVDGRTVITIGGKTYQLSATDLSELVAEATELVEAARPPTAVGDFVWNDADGDGLQDAGELGLGGVGVRLVDAAGRRVAEDVTDRDGRYELTPTVAGAYTLEVVIPSGFAPTLVDAGTDDAIDSDVDPATVIVSRAESTARLRLEVSADSLVGVVDIGLVEAPDAALQPTTTTTVAPTTTTVAPTTTTPTTPTTVVTSTTVPATTAPPATQPATTTTIAPTTLPAATVPPPPAPTTSAGGFHRHV